MRPSLTVAVNTDIKKGADWKRIIATPVFSENNNTTDVSIQLTYLFSPFLDAYLIRYYVAFVTKPNSSGFVYLNTGLDLMNANETESQTFNLISQVDATGKPYAGDASIGKYCQNGKLWFKVSFRNSPSMSNTVVRALGTVLILKDVLLW